MSFPFNLGAFLFAAGLAQSGLTQTPPPLPDVSAIFGALIPKITAHTDAVASFASGGGTLIQALGVYSTGRAVIVAVNSATGSIQVLPQVPDAIGAPIYNQFLAIAPAITQSFNNLNSNKNALNAVVPGSLAVPLGDPQDIIIANLKAMRSSLEGFVSAVLVITPPNILGEVQALLGNIQTELDNAITVYSS